MARIEGVPAERAGLFTRLAYFFARKKLGQVPEPMTVTAHHPWIFRGYGAFELALERAARVSDRIKALAGIKAATLIGCPF